MVNTLTHRGKSLGRTHEHIYKPRGGCTEVFNSQDEEVLISGPAGTGKSRACLEKILAICLLTPGVKALILRKTLSSLGSSALDTWRKFVAVEAMATGAIVYYGGSKEEPAQYRFKNGSKVVIGGLDKASRIMSTEYDIIYVQEATEITLDDLELLKTRLRNWRIKFQQLLMDCNPAGDKHWLKLRCNDGMTTLIESRHEDNPRLYTEDKQLTERGAKYMALLDNLTGVRHKRLRLGLWVSAEGIVYEEFDPAIHVCGWEYDDEGNKLPLPDDWIRYWVIDFGFSHPFVLQCYARDPDGVLYMYREIYMTQRTVNEHAQTILDVVAPYTISQKWFDHFDKVWRERKERVWIEPKPWAIFCDWDAEGRRTFERDTGLSTRPATKNVYEGINAHKQRLKDERFFIMEDALVELDQSQKQRLLPTSTLDEYASYVWKLSSDGRIQDEPVKQDDDGMDCARYMTAAFDLREMARATQI